MRRFLFILIFAATTPCFSQGTVDFSNCATDVVAPITNAMVVPHVWANNGFRAQLYVGPAGSPAALLTTNGISGAPSTLLSGGGAGCFLGNVRTIDGFLPGTTVTLQVRAWAASAGANWETALGGRGESNLIQVTLGGGLIPTPRLFGLQGFHVAVVPEPSSFALAVVGLVVSVTFRLRRRTQRI
jgi:hypothetical protein